MLSFSNSCPEGAMSRVKGGSARVWKPLGRPLVALRSTSPSFRSCHRLRLQPLQPHQVVRGPDEGEQPSDFLPAPQLHLSQHADYLHPSEALFHAFPFLLTDRVARVPGRASVNRTRPVRGVLR